ncbi:MAG TPA: hypothetical protein VFG15_05440 [Amycolatopsis sp.]|nr:hypothetical protein [Amycolatopsis sp.]
MPTTLKFASGAPHPGFSTLFALPTSPLRQAPTSVLDAVNGSATKNATRAMTPKMPSRMISMGA